MAELSFSYDAKEDLMVIEGIKYTGYVFRNLGNDCLLPTGVLFSLVKRENGTIIIRRYRRKINDQVEKFLDEDEEEIEKASGGASDSDGAVPAGT
jgi:hypothetical protein